MKKRFSLLLVLVLLCSLIIVGCNGKNHSSSHHVDKNDDGICDDCHISVLVTVDFYAVNDLHGKFDDTSMQPGVDELSTFFEIKKNTDEHVVLLSSGDMWQGSSESNLTEGNLVTEWMNEMGFVAMAMGNHEYDWGEEIVQKNAQLAEFPFLAINLFDVSTNKRVDYCDASVIVEKGGIQIGIIGAIGDCYSSIASDHTKGIYFKTGDDLTALVMDEADRLRKQGADYIVYSIHDGYGGKQFNNTATDNMLNAYYDVELSNGYVDLVFEAHTHQYYTMVDKYGVYHLQGGGENTGISHAEITVNTVTGTTGVNEAQYIGNEKYKAHDDHPIVDELLEKYDDQISAGREVLGYNARSLNKDYLCRTAARLYYEYGNELWGSEYDIVLGGGFFSVRSPGYLTQGDVTYSQLQMIFPFDNYLTLCSIKGRDLQEKFFETDNDRYYIYYTDYGAGVRNNIDPDETYYVIVDSYTSTFRYNNLTEIYRYEENFFLRDMYAQYVRDGGLENN